MRFRIYILTSLLFALLTSCKDAIVTTPENEVDLDDLAPNDSLVLISSGGEGMAQTRATVKYMPDKVRFSALMMHRVNKFYDYSYDLSQNAFMVVQNGTIIGNSLYYQSSYNPPTGDGADNYHNDKNASIFHWSNRLEHCFIGYIDDYNKALNWAQRPTEGSSTEEYKPQSLDWITSWDQLDLLEKDQETATDDDAKAMKEKFLVTRKALTDDYDTATPYRWQQYFKIDLSDYATDASGEPVKDDEGKPVRRYNSMSDMPDPLIAITEKKPEGSTSEQNRVYLTFKHQLAQVQVNVKGSEMGGSDIVAEAIQGVDMLGVSTQARIFPFPEFGYESWNYDREDESPVLIYHGEDKTILRPAEGLSVDLSKYNDEELDNNRWGTKYSMYPMGTTATGYQKSFEAVAFGTLQALRLYWVELEFENGSPKKDESGNVIPLKDKEGNPLLHVVTFVITDTDPNTSNINMKNLQSGKRYIFNLEMRRGTLAVVRADIADWLPYEYKESNGDYKYEDGTIIH